MREWSQKEDPSEWEWKPRSDELPNLCEWQSVFSCPEDDCCQVRNKARLPGEETVQDWDADVVPRPSCV